MSEYNDSNNLTIDKLNQVIRLIEQTRPKHVFDEILANEVMLQQVEDLLCSGKEIIYDTEYNLLRFNGITLTQDRFLQDGIATLLWQHSLVGIINLVELKAHFITQPLEPFTPLVKPLDPIEI